MSRLDDELRNAFRREQPSVDFTARLLKRVAQQPPPKLSWWQRLATVLEPPKLRWVAIGVTASLLLAIGAAQYRRLNQPAVSDDGKVAARGPSAESIKTPESAAPAPEINRAEPKASPDAISTASTKGGSRTANLRGNQRLRAKLTQQEQELKAEGEAAKETLMLALSIASSALSDAQKAVHQDGLKP
jgi:hypothetical protein